MENDSAYYRTEFYAYNLDSSGIKFKRYVYPPSEAPSSVIMDVGIDENQFRALSLALESSCFSTLDTNRFSLYDISFRGVGNTTAVSFNFTDTRASEYLSTAEALKSVSGFDVDPLVEAAERLEKSVFPFGVDYNPNWMFGLLFERDLLVSVKAYLRFDIDGALGLSGRQETITRIMRNHNAPEELENELLDYGRWLDDCGFFLRILGIDQKVGGKLRYKFYFRTKGDENPGSVGKRLVVMTKDHSVAAEVEEVFQRHRNGMWGLGISVGSLNKANGFQLYFYP